MLRLRSAANAMDASGRELGRRAFVIAAHRLGREGGDDIYIRIMIHENDRRAE